jgi:hypothetical protein
MHQASPAPKTTLPELRSKCRLTQKILSEPCPEFEEIRRIIGQKETKLANANATASLVSDALAERERAKDVWFDNNSLENFKKLSKAHAEYEAVNSAYLHTLGMSGGVLNEWIKGDDIRAATKAGLRVIQKRLATKIAELNAEERKRMEEAGLDPSGEHPSITGLKRHLSAVAEAIIRLQDGAPFNWNEYSNLFQS